MENHAVGGGSQTGEPGLELGKTMLQSSSEVYPTIGEVHELIITGQKG